MKKTQRIVLAVLAAAGLLLAGSSVSWAGDDPAQSGTGGTVKTDVEKAEKAVEKKVEEKVDEVTYKPGEKPGDIYKDTADPCAEKAGAPCGGKE